MGLFSYFKPAQKSQEGKFATEKTIPDVIAEGAINLDALNPGIMAGAPSADLMNTLKCEIMADYLHQQQQQRRWIVAEVDEGVILKKSRNNYTCCPVELSHNDMGLAKAIETLNVRVRMR